MKILRLLEKDKEVNRLPLCVCVGGERISVEVALRQAKINQHKFRRSRKPTRIGHFDGALRVKAK